MLAQEEKHFKDLEVALKPIPVYQSFLSKVVGVGPAMAGVILSEFDIYEAVYPSSFWKYAGLDVVTVGHYEDDNGKKKTMPVMKLRAALEDDSLRLLTTSGTPNEVFGEKLTIDGKVVTFENVGRSRKEFCLEEREYLNKEGEMAIRNSITFNPFLKTKLVGVLGSSFLRAGATFVDGVKLGAARRMDMAKEMGFELQKKKKDGPDVPKPDDQVTAFLRDNGINVKVERSPYGQAYYNYKDRLNNTRRHDDKSDGHKHNMAMRYMVKRFLVDLHIAWRTAEGLPVSVEYSEGKLGMKHRQAA